MQRLDEAMTWCSEHQTAAIAIKIQYIQHYKYKVSLVHGRPDVVKKGASALMVVQGRREMAILERDRLKTLETTWNFEDL